MNNELKSVGIRGIYEIPIESYWAYVQNSEFEKEIKTAKRKERKNIKKEQRKKKEEDFDVKKIKKFDNLVYRKQFYQYIRETSDIKGIENMKIKLKKRLSA